MGGITLRRSKQIKMQSSKEKKIEMNAHKNLVYCSLIPEYLEDLFVGNGEPKKQKGLLIDLCDRTVGITQGTAGIKFKFNETTYLTDMCRRFEERINNKFGDTATANSYVLIYIYMLTLEERQGNVMNQVLNPDGTMKYELLAYLGNICSNITKEEILAMKKELDSLMTVYFKSMYI